MFSCCRKNHTEKVLTYYPDGKIKTSYNYLNGKKHGLCIDYDRYGNIDFEYTYKNGVRDGEYKLYYSQGKLFESGTLLNDQKHGLIKTYCHDSDDFEVSNYKNGFLHGKQIEYFDTGKISMKYVYNNGRKDSYIMYYKNGKKMSEYYNTQFGIYGILIDYYETGEKSKKINHNRITFMTKYTCYYKSGAVKVKAFVDHKDETLIVKYYTEDGGPLFDQELIDYFEGDTFFYLTLQIFI